jgi:hypothetical protein
MDLNNYFADLTEEQKKKLKNAKSPEELRDLIDEEGLELSEDAIGDIAGGGPPGCYRAGDCPCHYWLGH